MADILEELAALRAKDAEERERDASFAAMLRAGREAPAPLDFAAAFAPSGRANVIAELKKASPSEGLIRGDFRPAELAAALEGAGAAALSVLCEPHRFLGGEEYLREARAASGLPILYKDFISTRYQVAAARAAGADAVLLIAAILPDRSRLGGLLGFAHDLGMKALVETHCEAEIDLALECGAEIVGVNCRNLRDFKTDVSLFGSLVRRIPADAVAIAESGMKDAAAVEAARAAGAKGFLVGTALMREPDPAAKLRAMVSR